MVMSRLRSLERRLALERAEVAIERQVNNLLLKWDIAKCFDEALPDPFEFIWSIRAEGFHLPTLLAATNYLSECKHEGEKPDKQRLLQILVPWGR